MEIKLVLLRKDGGRKSIRMPSTITIIGRRPDCDLVLPLNEISRRHCELDASGGELVLRDLGSSNGTFLNGIKITDEVEIKAGDVVSIGPVQIGVQIDSKPESFTTISSSRATSPSNHDDFGILDDIELDKLGGASGTVQIE